MVTLVYRKKTMKYDLQFFLVCTILVTCRLFADTPDVLQSGRSVMADTPIDRDLQLELAALSPPEALVRSIRHILRTRPREYRNGREYLRLAEHYVEEMPDIVERFKNNDPAAMQEMDNWARLKYLALIVDNPYVDFDETLVVASSQRMGTRNWESTYRKNAAEHAKIVRLNLRTGTIADIYTPESRTFLGELDLYFDAEKLLFTAHRQVWEVGVDGSGLRQVSSLPGRNAFNTGGIYLPNGKIIFSSTASNFGVPCVSGQNRVPNLFLMDADGGNVRQLTYDQDASWYPVVLEDGKVMYLRWEYTDIMHYYSRIMMTMNPDGSNQRAVYGSQSLWPNSMFFARPLPGNPGQFIAVVSGHHGVARRGKLTIFDTNKGFAHADGVVQHIPGYGQEVVHVPLRDVYPRVSERVLRHFPDLPEYLATLGSHRLPENPKEFEEAEHLFFARDYPRLRNRYPQMALDLDYLVDGVFPLFDQAYPISADYFLTTVQLRRGGPQVFVMVDRFDNFVPIPFCADLHEQGYRMLQNPYPLRKRHRPPVIPEKVDTESSEATLYIQNIYRGPGLAGVPEGTVDALRLFTYAYGYHGVAEAHAVGVESSWDMKRVLGTVKVEEDGSAMFKVPANTTISIQPLDEQGRAIQLFRSWLVAMPGETLSCIGCHESPHEPPVARMTMASSKPAQAISSWREQLEGFSFENEIQPILDAYCISCHDGSYNEIPNFADKSLRAGDVRRNFSNAYYAFHPYFRRPGPESTALMLNPYEYHASTSEGVQMLQKGHHGVKLDEDSWRRLYTWIDLNTPYHGNWTGVHGQHHVSGRAARATEVRRLYANVDTDWEYVSPEPHPVQVRQEQGPRLSPPATVSVANWPFNAEVARQMQAQAGEEQRNVIKIGDDLHITMVRIPAGEFVMGSDDETPVEQPRHRVRIERPFWISENEIDNDMYFAFKPDHNPSSFNRQWRDHVRHGYAAGHGPMPAVHVSWTDANRFCTWLSEKIGRKVQLPTEAQWEWACRAGAETAMSFGTVDGDFSAHANLADRTINRFAVSGVDPVFRQRLVGDPIYDFIPRVAEFDDGNQLVTGTRQYEPNAWGLYDMHGNVAEWTRSDYVPYPYREDRSNTMNPQLRKTVRGGSFFDRPHRATSSYRLGYEPWQGVFNVGFRIVIEE
jgi:formylglycine-generating enzyme required for sulfatase activity